MLDQLAFRLVQGLLTLVLVSVVTFLIIHLAPGRPSIVNQLDMSREERERVMANLGLDRPLTLQYAIWLSHVVQGDLGRSVNQGVPVGGLIGQRLPNTVLLSGTALVL